MNAIKKIVFLFLLIFFSVTIFAQESEDNKTTGFQKEKLFTGGDLSLSFYSGGIAFGITPFFGYSVAPWLDAAISLNFYYATQNNGYSNKYRQTNVGPGAFIKIYPLNFLYVQTQFEHNFINSKFTTPQGATFSNYSASVNSLLLGLGYCTGRASSNNSFFYFLVSFDVLGKPGSPYVDYYGRLIPVIKAGYNIALFQRR